MEQNISTGLGLDVNLRIGELQNTLEQLTSALTSPIDKVSSLVADSVQKFRDAGISDLAQHRRECCERGDESCCEAAGGELFNKIVNQLKTAASKGVESAKSLLNEIGELTEAGGQKMQEAARPSQESQQPEQERPVHHQ